MGIAESILRETHRLSGLSLVRATGIGQYIRDFMAYAITCKLLQTDSPVLCDQLVSLDAYRHWFDSADSDTRPDLLWVVTRLGSDGRIHLDLRLLECKLAQRSDQHLEKARQQLENGLRHLTAVFMPRVDLEKSEDERPDQRYWWLQLHRLIASKAEISGQDQCAVLLALERLGEGIYSITWRASAVTYWTDQTSGEMTLADEWQTVIDGQPMHIGVTSAGSDFVRHVCTEPYDYSIPWPDSVIRFEGNIDKAESGLKNDDGLKGNFGDGGADNGSDGSAPVVLSPAFPAETVKMSEAESHEGASHKPTMDQILARILLGRALRGGRAVYWEFGHKELSNRHMLIFGTSGMGKTYAIQCLLCELGNAGQNSLIIDYTNGFLPNQLETETRSLLDPKQHVIRQSPLPVNPFRLQPMDLGGLILSESESAAAKRISSIFQNVYGLGEQQFSVLFDAIVEGLLEFKKDMSFDTLVDILTYFTSDDSKNKNAVRSTLNKIKPFVMDNPFLSGTEALDWNAIFDDHAHRCHIFQLAGLDFHTWRLVAEFALWDFYAFLQNSGSKNKPKVLVLDEVQNLDHRDGSPLSKYLREGRKFGVSLIMATQIMSNLEKDERARLFNAAHKLFFRPADTEIRLYADIASVSTGEKVDVWMKRLASLEKGECYSLGPSLNESTDRLEQKAFKIKIMSLAKRGING